MRSHSGKSKAAVESAGEKLRGGASAGLVITDNRPDAAAQACTAELINSSPRQAAIQRQSGFAGRQVSQLKTKIENEGQTYNYLTGTVTVGEKMESWLDPQDPEQGQSANLNTSQDEMMGEIRKYWNIKGGDVVKGHLLNDNLGGKALNNNLYPITRGANKDHLRYVENAAKEVSWKDGEGVYYKVEVNAEPEISENMAYFDIEMRKWNPTGAYKTDGEQILGNLTVPSDLEDVRAKDQVYDMDMSDEEVDSFKNPKKTKTIPAPKKRVGDLTDMEMAERDEDQ